jgi:hypothetical protein
VRGWEGEKGKVRQRRDEERADRLTRKRHRDRDGEGSPRKERKKKKEEQEAEDCWLAFAAGKKGRDGREGGIAWHSMAWHGMSMADTHTQTRTIEVPSPFTG